jgi:hypothetical protein
MIDNCNAVGGLWSIMLDLGTVTVLGISILHGRMAKTHTSTQFGSQFECDVHDFEQQLFHHLDAEMGIRKILMSGMPQTVNVKG